VPADNAQVADKNRIPERVLVIDVGGNNVKMRLGADSEIRKFRSGPKLDPETMVARARRLATDWPHDAVSIGYPGLVLLGKPVAEPYYLGEGWVGFDYQAAFERPVKLINDAAMQAIGSYRGGRMLFLGLGTGLGATLIIDHVVQPLELGHLPYKGGLTHEQCVNELARERLGTKKWRDAVQEMVEHLATILEVDSIVLGGGNAKRLKTLPPNARRGDNNHAFVGGVRLWRSDEFLICGAGKSSER
jgi:polyphosphate glucokinase